MPKPFVIDTLLGVRDHEREESRGRRPGGVAEKVRVFLLNYMNAIAVQPQRRLF